MSAPLISILSPLSPPPPTEWPVGATRTPVMWQKASAVGQERFADGWVVPDRQRLFLARTLKHSHTPCFRGGFLGSHPVPSWLLLKPFSFLSPLLPLSSLAWPRSSRPPAVSNRLREQGGGTGRGGLQRTPDGSVFQQNRQMKHISAEQKRRFNIKMGFDTLNSLISNNSKLVSCLGALGEELSPGAWALL